LAKKIMIVDDSPTILEALDMTLSRGGLNVSKAAGGEGALGILGDGFKPDMIITDLNMSGMNGIQFVRKVRTLQGFQFVPVLMLTTESEQSKRDEAKAAGATGWMVKPFKPETVLQVVKQLVPGA
jgi:two-component system, chemotaxis family, chemotaxis protein CheY